MRRRAAREEHDGGLHLQGEPESDSLGPLRAEVLGAIRSDTDRETRLGYCLALALNPFRKAAVVQSILNHTISGHEILVAFMRSNRKFLKNSAQV